MLDFKGVALSPRKAFLGYPTVTLLGRAYLDLSLWLHSLLCPKGKGLTTQEGTTAAYVTFQLGEAIS